MHGKPLISIALATFNGAEFLEAQLESLLAQDYSNFEIVISDDSSTDGTWEILKDYASKDNRIRLLPREFNCGYVKNFIRAFRECKGEFISPSDQDDVWYPQKTARLIEEINGADLIYCNNRYIDANGNSLGVLYSDKHQMFSGKDARQLLFATSVCGHASVFRKKILYNFDVLKNTPYIDWTLAFIAANGNGVKYLDEVLVDWRQHASSFTAFAEENNSKKRKKLHEDELANLDAFSLLFSEQQEFIARAKDLHYKWVTSYFCPEFFFFVLWHKRITHALHSSKFPSLKYVLGYKLKKLLRPKHYE